VLLTKTKQPIETNQTSIKLKEGSTMQSAILKKLATGLILMIIGGILALCADSYLKAQVKPGTFSKTAQVSSSQTLYQYKVESTGWQQYRRPQILEDMLNKYGSEGWELVASDQVYGFIFMKSK